MDYTEIEIEGMKEILKDKEKEINRLNAKIKKLEKEEDRLSEEIRFLEECLDNKEKVNKSLREDLKIWKLTAKDYAKQCGIELDDNLNI